MRGDSRDHRQRDCRDGYSENSYGKLHESKREVQPRDSLFSDKRGKAAVHDDVDLNGTGGDHRRNHQHQDLANSRISPLEIRTKTVANLAQARKLHRELKKASDQSANGETGECLFSEPRIEEPAEEDSTGDRADVEKTRCHRRHAKHVPGVEHAHHQRGQRDEQNKGVHDLREIRRQLGILGRETRSKYVDELFREDHTKQADQAHENGRKRHHFGRELPGGPLALLLDLLREDGDEGRGKGSFRKKITEQIRGAKGDRKNAHESGSEQAGEEHFTDQSQEARAKYRHGNQAACSCV